MRLTVVGCGDAFAAGGRGSTCYHVESEGHVFALDFGASALVCGKRLGLDMAQIDAVVLSHLHGDHFGGLPFLILDGHMGARRTRPLTIYGPPGTQARLEALCEALFPGMGSNRLRYDLRVEEVQPGVQTLAGPLRLVTAEVVHKSGAPSTAVRVEHGGRVLAFSGDTEWTPALLPITQGADLFICECYRFEGTVSGHLSYEAVRAARGVLGAKRILLTHMSDAAHARRAEMEAEGFLVAGDGLVLDV